MANNVSLLGSTSRVEIPYVKVIIGDYTFGVYQKTKSVEYDSNGFFESTHITYPNYIQSLSIVKINGEVNTYTLVITYPVTDKDDPNFFEKVFSSVNKTRKIVFSYGDMSLPSFIYKSEEALITEIKTSFNIQNSSITYTVTAISSAILLASGNYTFINKTPKKPSDEIKRILWANKDYYGLQQIFYGMINKNLVEGKGLILSDDKVVTLETKTNISILDYLTYLVSCMIPASSNSSILQQNIYVLTIVDDITGMFGGPYFQIKRVSKNIENSQAYDIDVGYPTANMVMSFSVDDNQNYSILYDWQTKLNSTEYVRRLNSDGKWEDVYAPVISSKNLNYRTKIVDQTWWTKLTEFSIGAQITIKGLLRPAVLMSYVRLNVYFFGVRHISSGLYIITKQQDAIDMSGCRTTLSMTRVGAAD